MAKENTKTKSGTRTRSGARGSTVLPTPDLSTKVAIPQKIEHINEEFIEEYNLGAMRAIDLMLYNFYCDPNLKTSSSKKLSSKARSLNQFKQEQMKSLKLKINQLNTCEKLTEKTKLEQAKRHIDNTLNKILEKRQKLNTQSSARFSFKLGKKMGIFDKNKVELYAEGRAEKLLQKLSDVVNTLINENSKQVTRDISDPELTMKEHHKCPPPEPGRM